MAKIATGSALAAASATRGPGRPHAVLGGSGRRRAPAGRRAVPLPPGGVPAGCRAGREIDRERCWKTLEKSAVTGIR